MKGLAAIVEAVLAGRGITVIRRRDRDGCGGVRRMI
jgi:hypothetical protein